MSKFTYIDLFAGIGGFHLALDELGGECVFASEIDEKARATYKANHGLEPHGDIRYFTGETRTDGHLDASIPGHDILAAGFPCEPFSLAGVSARNALGRSHGLLDEAQGTLFYDIARIVSIKRPRVLFLENVSNIIRHDKGRTFEVLRKIIEDHLDYTLRVEVLNAETLVPQRRKRCFIVAFRDAADAESFEFPTLNGPSLPLKSALEKDVDEKFTISDRSWAGHQRRTKSNIARGVGFTAYEANLDRPSNTIVARYYKDGKECLVPQPGKNPRLLTPRECARLQGFPEEFHPHPTRSVAYKQFGNAVPVPLVLEVGKCILRALSEEQARSSISKVTVTDSATRIAVG
ncbi:MAG TPA: DNA (cytosine-5-)-methyltransferase [Octadecabacter sp.]|nr:DNA (cytosine-5-)-methyltransferase [Octadecabacter sp.]